VLELDGRTEASLHLKLPGEMHLEEAHEVAEAVEGEIMRAVPEVAAVQTHIEPLTEPSPGQEVAHDPYEIQRIVRAATGQPPRETRFLDTDEGLVVFLTLGLDPGSTLADAHELASGVEERIRGALPGVADVIVHTEP
jgi:divalent metal cation (Fe/Co/Zn/Cd) transporter